MGKIYSVAIIGCGSRGQNVYGKYMFASKDKFKIVSLCDANEKMLALAQERFDVEKGNCFTDSEEFFAQKRADVLVIATQDRDHVWMCVKALALGYDVLLEKPVSPVESELYELLDAQKKYGGKVVVCHVLRYAPAFIKLKQIIDSGEIGRIVSIDWTEQVAYWHQAHSFVRGNWSNDEETSPMIMQKCCHDLDLIQYFIGSRCKSVSSIGALSYFKAENRPQGAADRCLDCKYQNECKFSAKAIYLDGWKNGGRKDEMPYTLITDVLPLTEEALVTSLRESKYGRCVFACDNNVVDNQTVIMQFENGISATLKMEGFTAGGGRDFRFFGTEGELEVREEADKIVLRRFMETPITWKISELVDDLGGQGTGNHGGSDHRMIDSLYNIYFTDKLNAISAIEGSVESHYMALAAEESRLNGGKLIEIENYRN